MSVTQSGNPARRQRPATVNRRREERHRVSLERPLYVTWMQEQSLLGKLVEMSRSGFRLAHQFRLFHVGQEVQVSFPWGKVRAKVVWNHVSRHQVQTGFSVLEEWRREAPSPRQAPNGSSGN